MTEIEEIKKLKKLFDQGIINDVEFKMEKAKILGLDIPVENRVNDLSDEMKKFKKNKISEKIMHREHYSEKKDKITDEMTFQRNIKQKKTIYSKEKKKYQVKKIVEKLKKIILWALSIILWLFGIVSIGLFFNNGLIYLLLGIIMFVQGCMICPRITKYAEKYNFYKKNRIIIIGLTILLFVIICCIFPVSK